MRILSLNEMTGCARNGHQEVAYHIEEGIGHSRIYWHDERKVYRFIVTYANGLKSGFETPNAEVVYRELEQSKSYMKEVYK